MGRVPDPDAKEEERGALEGGLGHFEATQGCLRRSNVVCRDARLFTAKEGCLRQSNVVWRGTRLSTEKQGCLPRSTVIHGKTRLSAATQGCLWRSKVVRREARLFAANKVALRQTGRSERVPPQVMAETLFGRRPCLFEPPP
jgi:hypothetical protein